MTLLRRSLKNLIRSPLRTILIVVVLAVSVGLALTMVTVNGAAKNQLGSIQGEIGTDIQIRPAGQFGLMGGGEPLADGDVAKLYGIPHVVSVQKSTQTQYTGSNLQSAIDAGTLGRRFRLGGGAGFTMPIIIMGFDNTTATPTLLGQAQMQISDGRYFTSGENDADVLTVGQALAQKNGLTVGSEVSINGTPVKVVGIFTTGQRFGDNMMVMPLGTVQRLFDLQGVTSVTVTADNVGNVDGVVTAIRGIFDANTADVVTSAQLYQRINTPLMNASNASQTGMIVSFIVAAVIILFSVVFMMRQRVREIGILKAIGASNWHIALQFSLETLTISVAAAIVGSLIAYALAQRVAVLLVASSLGGQGGGGLGGGRLFGGAIARLAGINVAVSPEIFLYALGIAICLAIAASVFSSWYISRIKPAEVLRNE